MSEKCNFSREKSEKYNIYQLINSDFKHNHVRLFAIFKWKSRVSEEIVSGKFKLVNTHGSKGYVITNINYCKNEENNERLEIHLTIDRDNAKEEQYYKKTFRDTFTLHHEEELKLIYRINQNTLDYPKPLCAELNGDDNPDDKGGSLIAGQRP